MWEESHAATIIFGHLVIQTFASPDLEGMFPHGPVGERLMHIWPDPPKRLTWPTGKLLTMDEALLLGRSFELSFSGRLAPETRS